jgi:hypothetical protein
LVLLRDKKVVGVFVRFSLRRFMISRRKKLDRERHPSTPLDDPQ